LAIESKVNRCGLKVVGVWGDLSVGRPADLSTPPNRPSG
jgi:hypothetical protein